MGEKTATDFVLAYEAKNIIGIMSSFGGKSHFFLIFLVDIYYH